MNSYYPEEFVRENYNIHLFRDILFKNYLEAKKLIKENEKNEDLDIIQKAREEIHKISINSVIYSIMTVEAFLNDYLASILNDKNYYGRYDFLSIENKLNLCFDLIFKTKLLKDRGALQLLLKLNKIRNSYVHSKSKKSKMEYAFKSQEEAEDFDKSYLILMEEYMKEEVKAYKNDINELWRNIKDSVMLIKELCVLFDSNDNNVHAKIRMFGDVTKRMDKFSDLSCVIKDFKIKFNDGF